MTLIETVYYTGCVVLWANSERAYASAELLCEIRLWRLWSMPVYKHVIYGRVGNHSLPKITPLKFMLYRID